ncbi:unnamed protein product [Didymodactylos carnosus]|uniref:BZIP domain-containing protein n=1 Tax=Didymodactylos carnosus TaxID=1234261 RepID=A0A8S2HCS4_9BILA|nr:unnamed protein product [Didymodactylos carnosus]CAF3628983.1 unnamed protein product [Didymodactylos carnosus]
MTLILAANDGSISLVVAPNPNIQIHTLQVVPAPPNSHLRTIDSYSDKTNGNNNEEDRIITNPNNHLTHPTYNKLLSGTNSSIKEERISDTEEETKHDKKISSNSKQNLILDGNTNSTATLVSTNKHKTANLTNTTEQRNNSQTKSPSSSSSPSVQQRSANNIRPDHQTVITTVHLGSNENNSLLSMSIPVTGSHLIPNPPSILCQDSGTGTYFHPGNEANTYLSFLKKIEMFYKRKRYNLGLSNDYKISTSGLNSLSPSSSSSSTNTPTTSLSHHEGKLHTEDPSHKREMRLQKNREAARECRRKKKEYIKCLEERVTGLENQNKALIEELRHLKELYCQSHNSTPAESGTR